MVLEEVKSSLKSKGLSWKFLIEEIFRIPFGIATLVIGILLGLMTDRCERDAGNREIYDKMKLTVRNEANRNSNTIGWYTHYAHGKSNIKRELDFAVSEEIIKSEVWIRKADPNETLLIMQYLGYLRKLNVFKAELNAFKSDMASGSKRISVEQYNASLKSFDSTTRDAVKVIDCISHGFTAPSSGN